MRGTAEVLQGKERELVYLKRKLREMNTFLQSDGASDLDTFNWMIKPNHSRKLYEKKYISLKGWSCWHLTVGGHGLIGEQKREK